MRPLLLGFALILLPACGPSDADGLEANSPPECQIEVDGNVLIGECNPEPIEVTKQPENKIRVAKVAMIYGLESGRTSSKERVQMTIITGSDDWNFDEGDLVYITADDKGLHGYSDPSIFGFSEQERVEKEHHYQTNTVAMTGEQAIQIAEANEVEIEVGDTRFDVTVASDQMEELAKKAGKYINED